MSLNKCAASRKSNTPRERCAMLDRIFTKLCVQILVTVFLTLLAIGFLITPSNAQESAAPATPHTELAGAGSMYPDILFNETMRLFETSNPDVSLTYNPVGSGAGVVALQSGEVDFAVSSAPLEAILQQGAEEAAIEDDPANIEDETEVTDDNLLEIPITAGMLGILYNLDGIDELNLTRNALSGIFDGSIQYWNHREIEMANPDLELPKLEITVIGRSDASGANLALSTHLYTAENAWSGDTASIWPLENFPRSAVLVPGSFDLVAGLMETNGAIGYAPSAFGTALGIPMALLENQQGNFVAPTALSGEAAIEDVSRSSDPASLEKIHDPDSPTAYPIMSFFWLVTEEVYPDAQTGTAMRQFAEFILSAEVSEAATSSGYIPLPSNMRADARKLAETIH